MIIIDGRESELNINNFANLEELLITAASGAGMEDRIVTDVIINNEAFSELYPHQAEDIASEELESVEIRSMAQTEMALNIVRELHKVTAIMHSGGKRIATLFRQADDDEALELFQDLLEVTRDFLNMIGVLRTDFALADDAQFLTNVQQTSDLLTEMCEVLENEDWILLADLTEYEFLPVAERWQAVVDTMSQAFDAKMAG